MVAPARNAGSYLLPGSTLVKGYNLVPPLLDTAAPWTIYQEIWGSNYDLAEIQAQIDAGVALGANTFRLFGSVNVVANGIITQAEYETRQAAVAAYIASKNAFYFPTGFDGIGFDGTTPSDGVVTSVLSGVCSALVPYIDNILGFDILNESPAYTAARPTLIPTLRAILDVPFTSSQSESTHGDSTVQSGLRDAGIDFWSWHLYNAATTTYHDAILDDAPTLPVLIGEFGKAIGAADAAAIAAIQSYYALIGGMIERVLVSGNGVAGALAWNLKEGHNHAADDTINPSNQFATYRQDWSQRAYYAAAFEALPS